jgi:Fur family ferric uptake transcriptional regulator
LLDSTEHLSAEELHHNVRRDANGVGFATVYRTLRLLVAARLAEVRQFGDGVQRFESSARKHHDHMICLDCRQVFEFEDDEIERLQEGVATAAGFRIERHRLDLYVRCARENCEHRKDIPSD